VVILIIGIIINFAVISLDVNNPSDRLHTEARRLTSLIETASDEALLRSELIGIAIENDEYEFFSHDASSWVALEDTVFRKRTLPEEIHIEFLSEQPSEETPSQEPLPDIVLFMSGELTPFELKVFSDLTENFYRISGDEAGSLTLDHVNSQQ
jgi:general secretion pathway protein H